jgi:hypothetical protein
MPAAGAAPHSSAGPWPRGGPDAIPGRRSPRRQGWMPPQTFHVLSWCVCSTEYLPVPASDGWWCLVPIWEPDVTPNPLRRREPPVPYWARDP